MELSDVSFFIVIFKLDNPRMLSVMLQRLSDGGTERHANSWQTEYPGQSPKGWHRDNPL